ncbi:uncharacterized protein ACMZJ9_016388 isoform 1-T3 [Mantella aurantiaca]
MFPSAISQMEDKYSGLFEDGLSKKLRVRKGRPARWESHTSSTSAREETTSQTTITAPSHQTKTSNSDSCQEVKLDGHNKFTERRMVKEEYMSSEEEDTLSEEGNENVSSEEGDALSEEGHENVSPEEGDALSEKGHENVSSEEEDTLSEEGHENVSSEEEHENVSSEEGDALSEKGHENVSSEEKDTLSEEGHENVSSEEEHENLSFEEEHENVSSEEGDTLSGEGHENVSSWEGENKSSREKDLVTTEAVMVKDPPVSRRKKRRDMLKFNVGRSKDISEDLRKQVVEAHNNGKGYKRIAKDLDLHLSTVRKIVYKWKKFSTVATLPRSGRPPKIGAKARRTILRHMRENTMVTVKDLKASLALDNINVHESTIKKTLSKWCSWDFNMEEATALQPE